MSDLSRKRELIEKALNDRCSKEELKELYSLLTKEELHSTLEQGWTSLDPSVKLDDNSSEEIRKALQKKIHRSPVPLYTLRIAASIALLVGIYYVVQFFSTSPEVTPTGMVAFTTAAGMRDSVTLDDGSVVWLNAGSTLEFPEKFGNDNRTVTLRGEAFFDVAKEKDRPFIVHTGDVQTTVMGTSFNIKGYEQDQNIQVTVATGKVRVASSSNSGVILTPNRQTNYNTGTNKFDVRDINAGYFTDWRDGMLHLDGSLEEIVPILERTYSKKVVFENQALRSCRIAGNYDNESLDNVLSSFRYILESDYMITGDTVILKGKGCEK